MEALKLSPEIPGVSRYVVSVAHRQLAEWAATDLHRLSYDEVRERYKALLKQHADDKHALAIMGLSDRYFLMTVLLGRKDMLHPWVYARCREVQAAPDGHLDLWGRLHFKSSLITNGGAIQEILRDPEITVGLFSHTRPTAKKFLVEIKREFETNELLKSIYPDVLWKEPKREAPSWSEDGGLIVKRKGNPKESTLEAWGLVDGQPTSRHYQLRIYDDVVTRESVTTPEMVKKTTEALELSDNLGTRGGREWFIGTRYSMGDTYQTLLDRGAVIPRIYPATDDGTINGKPVLFTEEQWAKKKRDQPTTLPAQMLQNPAGGAEAVFNLAWLKPFHVRPTPLHVYILCDPSKGASASSDRTAMAVIGLDVERKKYLLDGFRHRMNLAERWEKLLDLHRKWTREPGVQYVQVGYESFGMQTDVEYFRERMRSMEYYFDIQELTWPRSGGSSKEDRVGRLVPDLLSGRFFVPAVVWHEVHDVATWSCDKGAPEHAKDDRKMRLVNCREYRGQYDSQRIVKPIQQRNEVGETYDLTRDLMEELMYFPFGRHDDLVDAVSRFYDMDASEPYDPDDLVILEPPTFFDT